MIKNPASLALEKRRAELVPHLVRLSEHAWLSVAEDVSNVGMIVGENGIVIIDTGMMTDCAARTLKKFREIAPADKYTVYLVQHTHP